MIYRFFKRDSLKIPSQERMLDLIRCPLITEKATALSPQGCYGFKVLPDANKLEIKKAIESIFSVQVSSVNTLKYQGKVKRFKGKKGRRSSFKKAMVTLFPGQSIDVLAKQ